MATLQGWRKAYGAIKDSTTVGLANLNSDYKDLDVAIVKAANHVECPPKERHLRKILAATSVIQPRADVAYCIHALHRRLTKTRNWTVALKALVVIHRVLREGDPTFREELLNFSQKMHILQLSNFKDDSSPIAWDCSAWVRTYALFLEERLECFRILKYDIEAERLTRSTPDQGLGRTRTLESEELLDQLPALQQLLYRLVGCRPEGAAASNYVIQYALALVLKESFKIYCAINNGIINLVDKFFEMPKHEALKALDVYRRAGQQAGSLSDFYEVCRGLELARNFQFPNLREPPQSFLATMEEYVREAPRVVPVSREPLEFPERLLLTYKPEEVSSPVVPPDDSEQTVEEPIPIPVKEEVVVSPPKPAEPQDRDLLGLNEFSADAVNLDESNALALAIVPSNSAASSNPGMTQENGFDPTGWELALVTGTSSLPTVESNLGGGLDKLTLDSLYDEAAYRQTQPTYGGAAPQNPFMTPDPFLTSNHMPAPAPVQMADMAQQQHMQMPTMIQANPFGPPIAQQHMVMGGATNPFGDAGFGAFPSNHPSQHTNPFGSSGLL